jgi:lysophospholipase L1-like esterase
MGRRRATRIGGIVMLAAALAQAGGTKGFERWEKAIAAMEARDQKHPPPKGAILLCGSSSARGWNVRKWFPDHQVVNRGFGGSQIHESAHFADRIILPHRPRIILLYAGDNDIASGKAPQTVCDNFKAFVARIHGALPRCRIVFIAIKPSLRRWHLVAKMRAANRLIQAVTEADDRLDYVDIDAPMIGPDGKPRKELFKSDGLHLNAKGYALWTRLVTPYLNKKQ